jgi:hypothetical protein
VVSLSSSGPPWHPGLQLIWKRFSASRVGGEPARHAVARSLHYRAVTSCYSGTRSSELTPRRSRRPRRKRRIRVEGPHLLQPSCPSYSSWCKSLGFDRGPFGALGDLCSENAPGRGFPRMVGMAHPTQPPRSDPRSSAFLCGCFLRILHVSVVKIVCVRRRAGPLDCHCGSPVRASRRDSAPSANHRP